MLLAMQNCGLTLEESFLGVTYNAAKSLKLDNQIGLLAENYLADIILWNVEDLCEIPYWYDSSQTKISHIFKKGMNSF